MIVWLGINSDINASPDKNIYPIHIVFVIDKGTMLVLITRLYK